MSVADLIAAATAAHAIDLSHPMTVGMPNHTSHPPYLFSPYLRFGDFELSDGYWGTNELIVMSGHSGTHLDSLHHVASNHQLYGGSDAREAQIGGGIADRGLKQHGIDSVEPIIARGLFLDVCAHRGVEILEPGAGIDSDEIEAMLAAAGTALKPDDCVLLRTGFARHWGDEHRYLGADGGSPGITLDGAELLADCGIKLIGADTSVVEQSLPEMTTLPVHMRLLATAGIHLLENMNFEQLAAHGSGELLFVCLPLRLKGASGSPARPIALLP